MAIRSIAKALALLDILAFEDLAQEGLALSDLARRVGQPLNTTHSQVRSLVEAGYAEQNAAGRYQAGPKCRQLALWHRLQRPESLATIHAALAALVRRTSEGAVFVTLVDGQWVSVARRAPDQAIQVAPETAHPDNIYTLATGRVLVAHADEAQLARILARHGLPGTRWGGLRNAQALAQACAAIRARGYELIRDTAKGSVMFALPVRSAGKEGIMHGALGCYAPLFRCPEKRLARLVAQARQAAAALGPRLG